MSIQQCYENFFLDRNDNECQLDDYVIYSHLMSLGYILSRSRINSTTANEVEQRRNDIPLLTPLIKPNEYGTLSTKEIYERLDIIPNITLGDLKRMASNKKQQQSFFRPFFDVYMP